VRNILDGNSPCFNSRTQLSISKPNQESADYIPSLAQLDQSPTNIDGRKPLVEVIEQ